MLLPVPALVVWALAARPFGITVVDRDGGAPIAGAVLETNHRIAAVTDRNGTAAFEEPGLEGQEVFFSLTHPRYELPADGFGIRGVRLMVTDGGSAQVMADLAPDAGAAPPGPFGDEATRLLARDSPLPAERFEIDVVDEATGRGVPLVELRGPRHAYVTDSAGRIAFFELDGMGVPATFQVVSHGYVSEDREVTLTPRAGGRTTLFVKRLLPAERLYRVTGGGIYRDTVLLGLPAPIQRPVLDGKVIGQDSVQSAIYQGQPFFIWGDTVRPAYLLGNFFASGARALLPASGGLPASVGIDLQYYEGEDGFSRPMAPIPGPGPTWLEGLVAVPDASGRERLMAVYGKYPALADPVEAGMAMLDDATGLFQKAVVWDGPRKVRLAGHAFVWRGPSGAFVQYGRFERAPATAEALADPSTYESFTPLREDGTVARDGLFGAPEWAWRAGAPSPRGDGVPVGMSADQLLAGHERAFPGGERVSAHAESIAWNAYRRRFVRVFGEAYGATSFLGELWYAEAETPMGPWVYSAHVVTHDGHTCYNPHRHPFLDEEGGRRIFFECTYSSAFSGAATPTPRYDYNQVMYGMDLDDPRLALPVGVYGTSLARDLPPDEPPRAPEFFALDRTAPGAVRVTRALPCEQADLHVDGPAEEEVAFWVLPEDAAAPGAVTLYRYQGGGGPVFSTSSTLGLVGLTPDGAVGKVWESPITVPIPLSEYRGPVVASAGKDVCASLGPVTLDGSKGRAVDGPLSAMRWTVEEVTGAMAPVTVEGERAVLSLEPGVYRATLEVTGPSGERATDVAMLQVRAAATCACGAGAGNALAVAALLALARFRARRVRRDRTHGTSSPDACLGYAPPPTSGRGTAHEAPVRSGNGCRSAGRMPGAEGRPG